jgi:hypothetical protein
MTAPKPTKWHPPFASNTEPMTCPRCEHESIEVRAQDYYTEGEVEAYCLYCHALLEVCCEVEIAFSSPEVVDDE